MKRRTLGLALLGGAFGLAGCASASAAPRRWHDGRIFLATGNTTGTFYQLGGGYADLVSKYVPGYELRAEPSGASGDNIARVLSGDMELALCTGDSAADAVEGRGPYADKPQPLVALARLYPNTMNVVVRSDAKIRSVTDLRGRRVSTGTLNSGSDLLAGRMLETAGLDPDNDIQRLRLSLPDTVNGMRDGTVDALFAADGLPTPGIADLLASAPGRFTLLPTAYLADPLITKYGSIYAKASIRGNVYGTGVDTDTVAVPTLLLAATDMPDELAYNLTRVLFQHQSELAKAHPEGADFRRADGQYTQPVPLHPGARRYYQGH